MPQHAARSMLYGLDTGSGGRLAAGGRRAAGGGRQSAGAVALARPYAPHLREGAQHRALKRGTEELGIFWG